MTPRTTRPCRKSSPTSCAKCAPATTARGSRIRDSCRSRSRSSTSTCPAPNQIDRKRDDVQRHRGRSSARPRGRDHREGIPAERQRRNPLPRGVARRPRMRPALQPDGGRGHRRDLAHAALAVDSSPRASRRRPRGDAGAVPADLRRRAAEDRIASASRKGGGDLRRLDPQRRTGGFPHAPGVRGASETGEE